MIWDVVEEMKHHKDKNHRENTDDLSGNRIFMSVIIPTYSDTTADRTNNPKNDSHWFNGHKHVADTPASAPPMHIKYPCGAP